MKQLSTLLLALLIQSIGLAQTLKLPDKVSGEPGQFIQVPATTDCATVKWFTVDKGLNVFPVQLLKDTKTAVVSGPTGTYRLYAYAAKGDIASDPSLCVITIGNPPDPTPGPGPGPNPPVPVPPVDPAPIPVDGFRVMIVIETEDQAKIPPAQLSVLGSLLIRTYVSAKCVKVGGVPEFRQWDKDTDLKNESDLWKNAMARPRKSLPWILISTGKTGFEGPLPGTVLDTLALLKKYGGE